MRKLLSWLFIVISFINLSSASTWIRIEQDVVTVSGTTLELKIQKGIINGIKNKHTGDVFAVSGMTPEEYFNTKTSMVPGPGSLCELKIESQNEAKLIYRNLTGGGACDELCYRIRLESSSGDIIIQSVFRCQVSTNMPAPDIPLVNIKARAVILGCGARYTRADPPVVNSAVRPANNLYAPPVAVLEGEKSSIFIWSDSFRGLNNVWLDHRHDYDNISLKTAHNYCEKQNGIIRSAEWRFTVVPSWLEATRLYRKAFEKAFNVCPLWSNPCQWVRSIHAVHTEAAGGTHGSPTPEQSDAYYQQLAKVIDPARLLLFYWNGNGIVLFGDHRYMTKLGWPKQPVIDAIRKYGFHWMGYHPYVLIFSPRGMQSHIEDIKRKGWGLPEGYAFTPDYAGLPANFHDYFRPLAHGYYQGTNTLDNATSLWVLHPGNKLTREYLVRNFGNYCKTHRMDGAYMDILGVGAHNWEFPENQKVMDGFDGIGGETAALRDMIIAHPELAIMSECQSEWTTSYTFYTWEGGSHYNLPRSHPSITTKVNHPIRTALWGSYSWTREEGIDVTESALIGGLPTLVLSDDWSVERAKL